MGRRHISATMLGITWREGWLGNGSAEVDQSLGLLDRQILPNLIFFLLGYVKNIVYQFKINDFQYLTVRIRETAATVTPNMLQATWTRSNNVWIFAVSPREPTLKFIEKVIH
jgi:hypothetical protein